MLGRSRFRSRARFLGSGTLPTLSLNFLSEVLDGRITFSRTTNATRVDNTGLVTYAPNNQVTYSEQFDNAAWTKTNSTITANATTAPDGTLTADKHIPNAGANIGVGATETRVFQSPSATIGVNYVYSMYAKAGEYDEVEFAIIATPTVTAKFSLTLGTVLNGTNAIITPVGDGWYRCSFTATAGVTGALAIRWSASSSTVSVGDGTSGIFVWGSQFEAVTYQTLPSTYNQTVASVYYGPRFDYNPLTLASLGLLIEEQRTNLIIRSEEFDNSTWAKDFITATANVATAPNGTTTADKSTPTAGALLTTILQGTTRIGATYTAGATLTFSVFAKQAEFNRIELYFSEGTGTTNYANVTYSLVDGSVVTAAAVAGTFTNPSSTSTSFGNGWYRFTLTFTTGSGASGRARIAVRDSVSSIGITGSGILLWGAQVEAGAFAASYIPTVASTVTRDPDDAVMTGTNFSSWYNQSEGTMVAFYDTTTAVVPTPLGAFSVSDTTTSERMQIRRNSANTNAATIVVDGGTSQYNQQVAAASGPYRAALAYANSDFRGVNNGTLATAGTSGTVPTVTQAEIGFGQSINYLNGHLSSIAYYASRLTDAQLQALTV
jgi:hypothetical protein